MSERDLFESVEQARGRLTDLRSRLSKDGAAPGSVEIANSLGDLQDMLDRLCGRYELLREILDRTNDMVFAKDRDGRYAMINPNGAVMFGKSVPDILGLDDRALFEHADAERIMADDRDVMATEHARTREETCVLRGVRATLLTTTTTWYDERRNVRGVIGTTQDVTERRRDERESVVRDDRMRAMATEIVIGEERLRRLLAAELHNGLGQDIALAKMKLSALRTSTSAELHDPLSGIAQLVERADRSLRSITYQISPPSLHDLGLVAALQWLGEDIGQKYGIHVIVVDDAAPNVADERVRVVLFRAVRELVTNVALHAAVKEVQVRIARRGEHVIITVEDAGIGFDTADLDRHGYGLFGIQEQLKYVDGVIHVESERGGGTTVTLTAPLVERRKVSR